MLYTEEYSGGRAWHIRVAGKPHVMILLIPYSTRHRTSLNTMCARKEMEVLPVRVWPPKTVAGQ